MSQRDVGGRLLPYEPGSTQYEEDEYRGQRRRPWMCFRVGENTLEITTESFMKFMKKLHQMMIANGVLLDNDTERLKYTMIGTDYEKWRHELAEGLSWSEKKYKPGPLSHPIVITLIDQCDRDEVERIFADFQNHMHFVKLEWQEVLEMQQSDDTMEMENLCAEFVNYLLEQEGLAETIAIKSNLDDRPDMFGSRFPATSKNKRDSSKSEFRSQSMRRQEPPPNDGRNNGSFYETGPPGLAPPGLHNSPQKSLASENISFAPPPGLEAENRDPRHHYRAPEESTTNRAVPAPPGLNLERPPRIQDTPDDRRNPALDHPVIHRPPLDDAAYREHGIWDNSPLDHGSVQRTLSIMKDHLGNQYTTERGIRYSGLDTDMASFMKVYMIDKYRLHKRLDLPYESIDENCDLLELINYATATINQNHFPRCGHLLEKVFDKGYPMKMKKKYLDWHFTNGVWSKESADMLFQIFMLFYNAARLGRSLLRNLESFIPAWEDIITAFENTDPECLYEVNVTWREFDNLKHIIGRTCDRIRYSLPAVRVPDYEERAGPSYQNDRAPPHPPGMHHHYENEGSYHQREPERRNYRDDNRQYPSREYGYEVGRDEVDLADRRHPRCDNQYGDDNQGSVPLGFPETSGTADNRISVLLPEKPKEEVTLIEKFDDLVIATDAEETRTNKNNQNEYQNDPLWKKFEAIEPPEDFKTLSTIPSLRDYMNSGAEPYLRRIQENGVYKSAAHYLDVQFRLLREDLVSSLRDGLDLYRTTGTCKGRRREGVECSDITISYIERVDEKQVSERDGLEMRVAWPGYNDLLRMNENEKEVREQGLAILSCDQFVKDFHLVIIQSVNLNKSCIHLVILDDSQPFKSNTGYQMAQGQSYLPSYQFVLENLKKINPFKPIPFERYLVNGKKEIFRPAFQNYEKNETQIAEESRLAHVYGEIRSAAAARRIMQGKSVPGGINDDDDADFCYKRNSKKSVETDEEHKQLNEPIFEQRLNVANTGSGKIKIDDKTYFISRLLNDFHPDYLDESQRVAFCHTFKSEISLIQGPPGTGKTHIGVQILKTMLKNRDAWNMTEPILVVCYSNNGLDNLLERVWQMIEDDVALSKDNGKPRMVRYGRKCESEFLRRRNVMRHDVNELYKQKVSENVLREQSKAGSNKRKKGEELAGSSCILYCTRNDIVSFDILTRVMNPSYQDQIRQFAATHVDTNERLLSNDEALACWLLHRDFGAATKVQTKKGMKFAPKEDTGDDDLVAPTETITDDEDDDDLNEDEKWDRILNRHNIKCSENDVARLADVGEADEYYTKHLWEIASDNQQRHIVLMGRKEKNGQPVDERIASILKEVRDLILSNPPLKKEELADIKYIFTIERPKRWALYQTWCAALRSLVSESLPKQIRQYRLACQEAQKAHENLDAEVMKMSMIVGCTTTGCARLRSVLEQVKPRILIVEEAAQVLEGHIVSAMISSIEQVVMIGDHKQLRPSIAVNGLHDFGLDISMFERLVERGLPFVQLREQHRMNTTISELIVRPAFYSNVHDAENVFSYPNVEGMYSNLFFWSHREKEETPDGVSWMNKGEVAMTAALVTYLLKQSYTYKDIVVLATYSAQRALMFREYPSLFSNTDSTLVPVETVDSYQGRESKIVIVSLVRSHRGIQEYTGIGFLAVANRICVALTRAQHGMYIVGNGAYIRKQSQLWYKIAEKLGSLINYSVLLKCTAHEKITEIEDPREFSLKAPEGGCDQLCNIEKECGHVCDRKCHPHIEVEHAKRCENRCMKHCPNPLFNHKCNKKCFEECGSCMSFVEVDLSCGHRISTPCSRIQHAKCDQKCENIIPCGHRCANDCGAPCTEICQMTVHTELKCGHVKEVVCGLLRLGKFDRRCVERCENRMLICEHQCAERCGETCTVVCQEEINVQLNCNHSQKVICSEIGRDGQTDHIQCKKLVPTKLDPCNHSENVLCGSDPSSEHCTQSCREFLSACGHTCGNSCGICFKNGRHVCQHRCEKVLDCGHTCTGKCGEECPPCKTFCSNNCPHQSCGFGEKIHFKRECHQLCALCSSTCSNKCMHRSCTKRCFEECNVKVCNEPCIETLTCGHACLGMCGETCPKICGTCDKQKYVQCVSTVGGTSPKIHRLIMNSKCHHVYPVQVIDAHVTKQMADNKQLTCPMCNAYISGVLRYAKYMKKRFLDVNMKKLRMRAKHIDSVKVALAATNALTDADMKIRYLSMNTSKEFSRTLQKFQAAIRELTVSVSSVSGKAEHKWRLAFYTDVALCFHAVTKLLQSACKYRFVSRKNIHESVDMFLSRVFSTPQQTQLPFQFLVTEIHMMIDNFLEIWKSDMVGAVIPKMRFHIAKMAMITQVIGLAFKLQQEKIIIAEAQTFSIREACRELIKRNESCQLDDDIGVIQTCILNVCPRLENLDLFYSWAKLKIPKF